MKMGKKHFFKQASSASQTLKKQRGAINSLLVALYEGTASLYSLVKISPDTLNLLYAHAVNYYSNDQLEKAAPLFLMLSLADGLNTRYLMGLAACHQRQGAYQTAADLYIACNTLDEASPVYCYHAADCFLEEGDPFSAILCFEKVIQAAKGQDVFSQISKQSAMMIKSLNKKFALDGKATVSQTHRDTLKQAMRLFDTLNQKIARALTKKQVDTKEMATIAKEMGDLDTSFRKKYSGKELLLLKPTFKTATLFTELLAMGIGSPKLLMTLGLVEPLCYQSASPFGCVDPTFEVLLKQVNNALHFDTNLNTGTKRLTASSLRMLWLLATLSLAYTREHGVGFKQTGVDPDQAKAFTCELLVHLVLEANISSDIFTFFLSYTTENTLLKSLSLKTFETALILLTLFILSSGRETAFETLLDSHQERLYAHFDALDTLYTQALEKGLTGQGKGKDHLLFLQRAKLALVEGDAASLSHIVTEWLATLGLTKQKLHKSLETIGNYLNNLIDLATKKDIKMDFPLII